MQSSSGISEIRRLSSRRSRPAPTPAPLPLRSDLKAASRRTLLLGTAMGLVLAAYAAAPSPALAANECGPPPPGGGTVTCTPAGNTYPSGIDYDPVVVDLTVVLQPGVVVINNGTPAQPNGVEIGSSTAGVDLSLQGGTNTSITTNAAGHDGVDVVATDGTVTVVVDDVSTTLATSRGIVASGRGTTTVTADMVSTLGDNSDGISAEEGNFLLPGVPPSPTGTSVTVNSVATAGDNSTGITAFSENGAVVVDSGTVTTTGDFSRGLLAIAAVDDVSVISDAVTTSGTYSIGIEAQIFPFPDEVVVGTVYVDSGSVQTSGAGAGGIVASSPVTDVTVISNTVSTGGNGARGISAFITGQYIGPGTYVFGDGDIVIQSNSIQTTGADNAGGIFAVGADDVTITSNNISTLGNASAGIYAEAYFDGNVVITSGTVTTAGGTFAGQSHGIHAKAENGSITIDSNTIGTAGAYSRGIFASSRYGGVEVVSNSVVAEGAESFGIVAEAAVFNGDFSFDPSRSVYVTSNSVVSTGQGINVVAHQGNATIDSGTVEITGGGTGGVGIFSSTVNGATTISSDQVITDGDSTNGILADSFFGDILIDSGLVHTQGNDSEGIFVRGHSISIVSDEVSTEGADSDGIYALGSVYTAGETVVTSGVVTTLGDRSVGIYTKAYFDGNIVITSGSVTTAGNTEENPDPFARDFGAHGIEAVADDGSITITSNNVQTSGEEAKGILADSFGGDILIDSGVVTTLGANSTGIDVNARGSVRVTSDVLETNGQESDGITVIASNAGDVDVTVDSGSVRTNGPASRGVFAFTDFGDVFITSDEVVTSGNYSGGVFAITSAGFQGGTGLARIESGSVFTSGNFAPGLSAYGGTTIIVSGSVTTEGSGESDGIFARSFIGDATIVSGTVATAGDDAFGIYALARSLEGFYAAGNVTITSDTVTTSGANSTGIRAEALGDRNVTINSGAVTATGPGSDGILALTETGDLVVILSGDVSAARGGVILVDGVNNSVTTSGAITGSIGLTLNRGTTGLSFDGDITGTDGRAVLINNATLNILGGVGNINGDVDVDGAFNVTRSQNLDINGGITGVGAFTQVGSGITSVNGTSTHTGGTFVTDGTLLVNGSHSGGVDVFTGGTIGGTGTIDGNVAVADGATLAPGQVNGPGTLTVGSLDLSPNSFLNYQLGAPGVVGGGINDLTNVLGDLTLDGILNVFDAGGFGPGIYRIFNYGGTLTDNGLAIGTTPDGTAPDDFDVQTAVANQVNLVTTAGQDVNFWDGGDPADRNDGEVDGGSGVWNNVLPNWTVQDGNVNTEMDPQPGFAIFAAEPGTVTVDDSAGPVAVTGMQFAVDGYRIVGDPIFLSRALSIVRVGDGTADSAGFLATIDSELAGAGGLVKTDLGTLALTAANTFAGGTRLEGGTLRLLNDAALGTGTFTGLAGTVDFGDGIVIPNAFDLQGNVTFNQAAGEAGLSGDAADSGGDFGITKTGGGLLTLSGTNTFGGQTTVVDGILQLVGGTALSDAAALRTTGGTLLVSESETIGPLSGTGGGVDVAGGQTLSVNQTVDATFGGIFGGTGTFAKLGLAELTLTGDSGGFGGTTSIFDGTLTVNGILGGPVNVFGGGTLGGTGTVGGFTAESGGTVAPGDSIGTLQVAGNLTFNPGSFFEVEIAADGSSDRIEATGTATLNGGTVEVLPLDPDTSFAQQQTFTILSAQGGVAGQFDGVSEDSAFLDFTLTYNPTSVFLNSERIADFTAIAETFNQRQTAGALENFDTTPGSDSLLVLNSLLLLNEEEAREAFDLASGEIHASLQHNVLDIAELYANTLQRRAGVLAGSAALGFDVAPLGYTMGGKEGALPPHALAVDAPAAMIDGPAADNRLYGVWAAVLGETGEIDGDGNAAELDYDVGGLAGGVDGTFDLPNASAMLGISAGYTTTDADVSERQSSADISSVHLGLYGAWDNERLRLSAAAAYGFHDIETEREISFDGIDRTAEADYDGHSFAFSGEAAYRFGVGRMSVAPLATTDLLWGSHDDAEESGADSLNLSIDGEDFSRVEAGIGIALGGRWAVGTSLVTAEARILWEHAFGDDTPDQDLVLAGAPGTSFTVLGPDGSEDWLTVGTGVGIALSQGLTLSSHYQGAISGDASSHQGHISLGYRF